MRIITVPPHSSDSERDDTGDFATRAREGGLRTFFERRHVDATRYDLAVETSRFRRASSDDAFSDVFDDPLDREEAPRRTLISQGFAALRRTRAFVEAFDAFDAVDDPDDRSVLEELFDEEEYDDFITVAALDPEDSRVDDDRARRQQLRRIVRRHEVVDHVHGALGRDLRDAPRHRSRA